MLVLYRTLKTPQETWQMSEHTDSIIYMRNVSGIASVQFKKWSEGSNVSSVLQQKLLGGKTTTQRVIQHLLCYLKCRKDKLCDSSGALICLRESREGSLFQHGTVQLGRRPVLTKPSCFKNASKHQSRAIKDTQGTWGPPTNYWDPKGALDIWSLGLFF